MDSADREAYRDMYERLREAAACSPDGTAALAELAEYARRRAKGREAWRPFPPKPRRGLIRRMLGAWAYRLRTKQV